MSEVVSAHSCFENVHLKVQSTGTVLTLTLTRYFHLRCLFGKGRHAQPRATMNGSKAHFASHLTIQNDFSQATLGSGLGGIQPRQCSYHEPSFVIQALDAHTSSLSAASCLTSPSIERPRWALDVKSSIPTASANSTTSSASFDE